MVGEVREKVEGDYGLEAGGFRRRAWLVVGVVDRLEKGVLIRVCRVSNTEVMGF